jgi:hypothetical protein
VRSHTRRQVTRAPAGVEAEPVEAAALVQTRLALSMVAPSQPPRWYAAALETAAAGVGCWQARTAPCPCDRARQGAGVVAAPLVAPLVAPWQESCEQQVRKEQGQGPRVEEAQVAAGLKAVQRAVMQRRVLRAGCEVFEQAWVEGVPEVACWAAGEGPEAAVRSPPRPPPAASLCPQQQAEQRCHCQMMSWRS